MDELDARDAAPNHVDDVDHGPHVRLSQNFGVAKATTNGSCAEGVRDGDAQQLGVRRNAGRQPAAGASASVGVFEGNARSPTAGSRLLFDHDISTLDRHAADGLGEQEVLAGPWDVEVGDVDLLSHRRLEPRRPGEERRLVEGERHPNTSRRPFDRPGAVVEDEKGDPRRPRRAVGRAHDEATSSPGRFQSASSVPGRADRRVEAVSLEPQPVALSTKPSARTAAARTLRL